MHKSQMKTKAMRYWERLRSLSTKGWSAVVGFLAVLGLVAAAVGNWATLRQLAVNHFGEDDATLVARRARLIPYFAHFPDTIEREQFALQFELRNYGASPVVLTSADIAVAHATNAKIGPGGSAPGDGGCTLSTDPNDNQPIELAPGESAWLEVSPMVNLPGIRKWLDSAKLANVHVDQDPFLTIHELNTVDELDAELARRFGPNATILVTLFTGVHQKRRVLKFSLANGKDMFAKDGSLMHDALISYWVSPTSKAAVLDCRKHQNS
ncbi:hypothetical protein [Dyella sp. 2RAF44]|uniref:hypothetical protein n=1 Tax=Dyella sp. 2RAF44 TaxID=3233000 RepID=UPI003F90CA92